MHGLRLLPERMRSRIEVVGDCWIWQGTTINGGYGMLRWNGKMRRTHRIAYQMLVGRIPEGLILDHLCRVRSCCNPAHLEPVTHRTNILRGEGLAAKQVMRTHCPKGHAYDEANTYISPSRPTARYCRTCSNDAHRRRRAAKKLLSV